MNSGITTDKLTGESKYGIRPKVIKPAYMTGGISGMNSAPCIEPPTMQHSYLVQMCIDSLLFTNG